MVPRKKLGGQARTLPTVTLAKHSFDRFIALSTPAMEDGNNFGVTVQMMVAKYCKDTREEVRPMYFKPLHATPHSHTHVFVAAR